MKKKKKEIKTKSNNKIRKPEKDPNIEAEMRIKEKGQYKEYYGNDLEN